MKPIKSLSSNFSKSRHPRGKWGFTLIELMVVVAIIAILAAIVIPTFLKTIDNARKKRAESASSATQPESPPPGIQSPRKNLAENGALPGIDDAWMKIILSLSHHRIGMDVFTRYQAEYKGEFTIFNPGSKDKPVRLDFRFPRGTTEARDVSLTFLDGAERWEPDDVIYDHEGILWVGALPGDKPVKAEVTFVALGRELFEYRLPPALRTKSVEISLSMMGDSAIMIPDTALQPTSQKERELSWDFENLVTDRSIVVELPGAQSPLGRVMLLCKLVSMAVLLFGAGFWYLAELDRPGRLHNFRWGHFMLLALTYSLFFLILATLSFHGKTTIWASIGIAALLSLPLLVLHVSRVIDMKFSLTRTLPLALFTLGLVINGVYGESARDYVFIGAAFFVVAFVTITYRKWMENRDKWQATLDENLIQRFENLKPAVKDARELVKKSSEITRSINKEQAADLKPETEEYSKRLLDQIKEYDAVAKSLVELQKNRDPFARQEIRRNLESRVGLLEQFMPDISSFLSGEIERIKGAQEDEEPRETGGATATPDKDSVHCIACGFSSPASPFCPNCGTERPLILTCGGCGAILQIPVHLMDREKMQGEVYCLNCGKRRAIG